MIRRHRDAVRLLALVSGLALLWGAPIQAKAAGPKPPTSFIATPVSSSQINLSWADSSTQTGFIIQQAASASGPWTQIANVGGTVFSYSVTGLSASTTYYFDIYAYNKVGDSSYVSASATTGCGYSLSSTSASFPGTGGSGSVTVNTATGCAWSISGVPSWITGLPASGSGPATLYYAVAANPSTTSGLSATLIIAGQSYSVSEAAAPCIYSLSASSASFSSTGGSGSVTLNTSAGCLWSISGVPSWITGLPPTGNGPATLNYTVAANSSTTSGLSATLTIGGLSYTVNEAAAPCTYSLSASNASFPSSGGSRTVTINTSAGCTWTISGVPSWISGLPANGNGPATLNYSVATNASSSALSSTLTIAGQTYTISEAAGGGGVVGCTYSLSSPSASFPCCGGSGAVSISADAGCAWTISGVPAWISGLPASGTGPANLSYTVATNTSTTASLSATLTIGGQSYMVSEAAAPCTYSLSASSASFSAAGGAGSLQVNTASGCVWFIDGVPPWITGLPSAGGAPATLNYTVLQNTNTTGLSATIRIGGQPYIVTQSGATPCAYGLAASSASFSSSGGNGSVTINTAPGCQWSISGVPSWISGLPSSGNGPATLSYTVATNSSTTTSLSATLIVAGQPYTVSEAAAPCTYSLSASSASFSYSGGSGSVTLSTSAGCAWTISGVPAWISGLPASGTGSATLNYTVATNSSTTSSLSATLTIAGQGYTVTEARRHAQPPSLPAAPVAAQPAAAARSIAVRASPSAPPPPPATAS